jgi:hypothetical protein
MTDRGSTDREIARREGDKSLVGKGGRVIRTKRIKTKIWIPTTPRTTKRTQKRTVWKITDKVLVNIDPE